MRVCGALGHIHPCDKPAAQVMIPHSTPPFLRRVRVFRGSMGASGGTGLGTQGVQVGPASAHLELSPSHLMVFSSSFQEDMLLLARFS